jgi:hypothetical protein
MEIWKMYNCYYLASVRIRWSQVQMIASEPKEEVFACCATDLL